MSANEHVFLAQNSGIHCLELEEESTQRLTPAIWMGDGHLGSYRSRTQRVPATRIYSFCDAPLAVGRTAIINAGNYCSLDYHSFSESSRFNEGRNEELILGWEDDSIALRLPSESIFIKGDCALITQQADHVWGHWLVDVLPRLELIRRWKPDITFAFSNLLASSGELLEQAGFRPSQMVMYDPYKTVLKADRFLVPGYVRFANAFATAAGPIFTSMSDVDRSKSNRIYVSRARLREGATIVNHSEIERMFVKRGFKLIHPETMSIKDQIGAFSSASHLAGEYGSGLHSSVFSASGVPVLCLQSALMKQYVQAGLGQVMGQPTGFVFGDPVPDPKPVLRKAASYRDRYTYMDPQVVHAAIDELLSQ